MKKIIPIALSLLGLLACIVGAKAQNVGIGTTTPNVSARLDISASNKGLLIPQVSLVSLTDVATIATPATGLLVYNTNATLGTGFYYNSGSPTVAIWQRLQTSGGGSGWSLTGNSGTDSTINFLGTTNLKPLIFRVNNGYAGAIGTQGGVAFGRAANATNKITSPGVIAIGDSALFNNADSFNVALGNQALFSNTTGTENLAIGDFSLVSNTTGFENTAIGRLALVVNDTGFVNTAVGYQALFSNEADQNTAVGAFALGSNFAGRLNTAVGLQALTSNLTGFGNSSVGLNSLVNNTDGDFNVAMGWQSMFSNTVGSLNVSLGQTSFALNTTGSLNTAVGSRALFANTTGNGNTAVGQKALATLVTGSFNTAIGDSADVLGNTALTNTTALGFGALVVANNTISIGNTAITAIRGQVGFSTFSDGRYKKDVDENVKGLDFIMQLRPVTYHYDFNKIRAERYNNAAPINNTVVQKALPFSASFKNRNIKGTRVNQPILFSDITGKNSSLTNNSTDASLASYYEEVKRNDGIRYTGFIAQEVEATAKKMGFDFSGVDKPKNENDHYALRYAEFVVPLVKAVQEQQAIIDAQNKKIDALIQRLEKLENK
jgi:trimeric autotransporter adhesin